MQGIRVQHHVDSLRATYNNKKAMIIFQVFAHENEMKCKQKWLLKVPQN